MTREEIQAVIDNGGYIYWDGLEKESNPLIKPIRFDGIGILAFDLQYRDTNDFLIGDMSWREATPEEIAKYVKP
jgi:hypothetical protein